MKTDVVSIKYRLYPNDSQESKLDFTLNMNRFLNNSALEHKIFLWKYYKKSISCYDQINQLPDVKELFPDFDKVYSQVLQATLRQLDKTFKAFFRSGKGFPRFKSKDRFRSFEYPQSGFSVEKLGRIYLSKIGHIKFKQHRELPEGKLKTCRIVKQASGKWFVILTMELAPKVPIPKSGKEIGIDLGSKKYITTSDNQVFENPKYFKKSENKLHLAQHKLSKTKRNPRRQAAKLHVARIHEKIKNQREDFQHKLSLKLVKENDKIYLEDLDIKNMKSFRNLNRAIGDCAWGNFVLKILYKAERAGKIIIKVDPRNTTSSCSQCGRIEKKSLDVRIHKCECGLEMDRDLNAAINIFNRGKLCLPRESRDVLSEPKSSRSPRL